MSFASFTVDVISLWKKAVNSSTGATARSVEVPTQARGPYGGVAFAVGALVTLLGASGDVEAWPPTLSGDVPEAAPRTGDARLHDDAFEGD